MIEPPVTDELFGEEIGTVEGDFNREWWVDLGVHLYNLDRDVLEDKPTEWVVGRCMEEQ